MRFVEEMMGEDVKRVVVKWVASIEPAIDRGKGQVGLLLTVDVQAE